MAQNKKKTFELSDMVDNLGNVYLMILFVSAVIWAFIAVNNFETPEIFKISLIYSLLLIFGFIGISYDRRTQQLGLDSRIWQGKDIKKKLLVSVIFFAIWYIVFMSSGFSVATAQSVTSGSLFSISPALNFFLTTVLGPLAENIFFFGVINITLVFILRKLLANVNNKKGPITLGVLMIASIPLFSNVPNSAYLLGLAGILTIATTFTKSGFMQKHAPVLISALIVGGVVFPKFHSFAYQLNERSYIAAQVFGIGVSIIASYIGILPVDILHIANNGAVALGLG